MLFDSYIPHRSAQNRTNHPRRMLYLSYNRLSDGGDVRQEYFKQKRTIFPPDIERKVGKVYSGGRFNVGNPLAGH